MNFKEYLKWLFTRCYLYFLALFILLKGHGFELFRIYYFDYNGFIDHINISLRDYPSVLIGEIIGALLISACIIIFFKNLIRFIRKHILK